MAFKKVPGEPLLYISDAGVYYLRKRAGGKDTHISLHTDEISEARKVRQYYWNA